VSAVAVALRHVAREPPEVRGAGRDDVALLVSTRRDGAITHARFRDLTRHLAPGDVLVVNTSATVGAALPARLQGRDVQVWLATPREDGTWLVELRTGDRRPCPLPPSGSRIELRGGGAAELVGRLAGSERLALARFCLDEPVETYLRRHGRPVRYGYVPTPWPLAAYQTVFGREPGSAELPSAGRPFTSELVTELVTRGILFAPVMLHTGLSSPERGEPPQPERFDVPESSARLVNAVHGWGGRVIAVGTTVVRALESVASTDRSVTSGRGRTSLVITPERGLRAVDGLLTGFHESESSHLQLLEAAAGPELLGHAYREALERGYLWHEFGDVHLILP
jgi:S-adenosylmethionine:tRNA ribosyltransferase-isomerase